MKFNKYHLAAGAGLVIILIVVFVQRSDWDSNKYILSADDAGNLEPKSEKYFDDKEKALLNTVNQKNAALNETVNKKFADWDNWYNLTFVKPTGGPGVHRKDGQHMHYAKIGRTDNGFGCEHSRITGKYDCPVGSFGIATRLRFGECGCAYFRGAW